MARCALVGIAAAALVILGVAFRAQHQAEGYLRTQEMLRAQLLLAEAEIAAVETQVEAEVAARRLAVAAQQEVARRVQRAEAEARAADARRLVVEGILEPPMDALDVPIATACQRAGRNLTADEWTRYVGPGVPYERTCAALP